jgi:hypothetical protein
VRGGVAGCGMVPGGVPPSRVSLKIIGCYMLQYHLRYQIPDTCPDTLFMEVEPRPNLVLRSGSVADSSTSRSIDGGYFPDPFFYI